MPQIQCSSFRYLPAKACADTPPKHAVVYSAPDRSKVSAWHPACFTHGLEEVDRHVRSAGIAHVELVDLAKAPAQELRDDVPSGEARDVVIERLIGEGHARQDVLMILEGMDVAGTDFDGVLTEAEVQHARAVLEGDL